MADGKPSFFTSLKQGAWGYIKGTLAGGAVGIIAGLAVGAAIGFLTGGTAAIAAAAVVGATWGGGLLATIGAISGAATEVVKGREAGQPTVQDIANMAKLSFVKGVGVGQQMEQQRAAGQGSFREREEARRAQGASQERVH